MSHSHHDWRGAQIHPGMTVLVASVVNGRMTQLELEVRALLSGDDLAVEVVRHTRNLPAPVQMTQVSSRWVTVVDLLPQTDSPTAAEERAHRDHVELLRLEHRLRALDAGSEPVFVREREITLTRIEKIHAAAA